MSSFEEFLTEASVENLASTITYLENLDRYQGSLATVAACEKIAEMMGSYGLSENVKVHKFPAGENKKYLGFAPPAPWGVIAGEFEITNKFNEALRLDHGVHPLLVATNSASFIGFTRIAEFKENEDFRGCVVLYSGNKSEFRRAAELITQAGGLGIISDSFGRVISGIQARGRIELPAKSAIFALSVTIEEAEHIRKCVAQSNAYASFMINTEIQGELPALEYISDPAAKSEIWLTAHICHPRPGANDNASGVAVALEVSRLLAKARSSGAPVPPIRILLAPEYVGIARYLEHTKSRPIFVINIDTVGGGIVTGAPLELELAPDFLQSKFQTKLVEIFQLRGVLLQPQQCVVIPFAGYSDHALFAARCIDVPAVQFGQSLDKYNHTDLDTINNISFPQLQWLCATVAECICEMKSELSSVAPKEKVRDFEREADYPFNIRTLTSLSSENDRGLILKNFSRRKSTYRELQDIWLLMQRERTNEEINAALSEKYPDVEGQVLCEFIQIVASVRGKLEKGTYVS